MRRCIPLIPAVLLLVLLLPSCGRDETEPQVELPWIFVTNHVKPAILEDAAGVLSELGPSSMEITDRGQTIRTCPGFLLTTSTGNDQEILQGIHLTDATVATWEGLYIGCTEEQVRAVYKDAEEDAAKDASGGGSGSGSFSSRAPAPGEAGRRQYAGTDRPGNPGGGHRTGSHPIREVSGNLIWKDISPLNRKIQAGGKRTDPHRCLLVQSDCTPVRRWIRLSSPQNYTLGMKEGRRIPRQASLAVPCACFYGTYSDCRR